MVDVAGYHILVVEDEYMLAEDLRTELEDAGAVVIGPEPSVSRAAARVADEQRIDFAVLDVNLGGETVFPVADALQARRVPFVFATGYEEQILGDRYPGAVRCDKPVDFRDLLRALKRVGNRDRSEA